MTRMPTSKNVCISPALKPVTSTAIIRRVALISLTTSNLPSVSFSMGAFKWMTPSALTACRDRATTARTATSLVRFPRGAESLCSLFHLRSLFGPERGYNPGAGRRDVSPVVPGSTRLRVLLTLFGHEGLRPGHFMRHPGRDLRWVLRPRAQELRWDSRGSG